MDTFPVYDRPYLLFVRGAIFRSRKIRLFGDYHALQNTTRVSDTKLHKQHGRAVPNFGAIVREHERENIVLIGSYAKFTQNQTMQQHLLGTGDRLLAEAIALTAPSGG